ncbi:ARM repeat-containing protein [Trametes coccinea BRFM310]|uniref:ARM repeat-containing protein n=1 Tax=Trametes coccinea (strain BRFM310) TaxID=1353009 RepID=A0A1Y2IJG8_TRAC3|nr:ARM repeat-containing protein [Trametes coccinea BRFM310]
MDYLRTLGSAAVSSLVQKSGLTLPFSLGPKVTSFENKTIWSLYDGTKRDDGSQVSIFEFEANTPAKRNLLPLAKNAVRKLRTVRHPDVLKFMDAVETDTTIHIMTERVRPLGTAIQDWQSKGAQEREAWLVWGLHRVSVALAFLNESASSTHGNVRVDSIFISSSGEWKLGGFDVLSNPKDDAAILYTLGGMVPDASLYSSPEVKKGGYSALKELPVAAADAYGLGLLIHYAFNPNHGSPATAQPPHPPPTTASKGAIPTSIFPAYKKLLNPNPKARLTPAHFLELGMSQTAGDGSGFFANNQLVKVCAGLDNFNLASEGEKASLLKTLKESAASFPTEFASYRVLPALISALEFGGASAATILPLVLQFGKNVPPEDYSTVILVHLVKLYASPDRGTRMALLDHLPEYADKLDKKTVVDKIWPNLQTGFTDTVAIIREATVKSIILLSDKFNERIMNNDLLRHLARMQSDPEASIRTNTCILIGRLGPSLGYNTKRKVLVPAFARALKDPFVHARVAGLMAFMATIDCFDIEDIATKVIPSMAFTMIDKEKLVRDQAFKAMELFMKKLEEHAATMPESAPVETEILPGSALPLNGATSNTLVNTAAGAAGALAGWAISSIGKKLAAGDLQTTMASAAGASIDRPTSAPAPLGANGMGSLNGSANALFATTAPPPLTSTFSSPTTVPTRSTTTAAGSSKSKGMQLGATKVPTSVPSIPDWAEEAAAEIESSQGTNPWGNDDLMDVNADEDDWSAFETAPAPVAQASGLGFGSIPMQSSTSSAATADPWAAPASNNAPSSNEWGSPHATLAPQPSRTSSGPRMGISTPLASPRPSSIARSPTPSDSGKAEPASTSHSTAGMSKEEKAAEMARRKEERRQRIAALKEQKKHAAETKT